MTRPVPTYRTAARASLNRRTRLVFGTRRDLPVAVHDRVGVPLRASCRRAVRSFRAGPCVRCRRGSPSRSLVGMRSAAGVDWLGGWRAGRGRRAARHGPQRGAAERRSSPSHRSRYSPARSRCIRTWTIRSAEVRIVVTSHGTLDRGRRRRGPAVAHRRGPPRPASTVENRLRDRRHTGALLPLTARLMSRADTQHATTTAVRTTGPATIRSSRPPRPARPDPGRRPQCSPAITGLDCG